MAASPCRLVTVIGYGNRLRGDDAAGQLTVEIVEQWELAAVRTIIVQQLAPELAVALAETDAAIFVDAYRAEGVLAEAYIEPIEAGGRELGAHTGDPRALLMMAQVLYGRAPLSWLVAIPAVNLAYNQHLSSTAACGVAAALRLIRGHIALLRSEPCTK
jgi:hydrogenase maturation protease